jgi:hypothetical protein
MFIKQHPYFTFLWHWQKYPNELKSLVPIKHHDHSRDINELKPSYKNSIDEYIFAILL